MTIVVVDVAVGMALLVYALHRLRGLARPAEVAPRIGRARTTTGVALLVVAVSEVVAPRTTAAVSVDAFAGPTGRFALLIVVLVPLLHLVVRATAELLTAGACNSGEASLITWLGRTDPCPVTASGGR